MIFLPAYTTVCGIEVYSVIHVDLQKSTASLEYYVAVKTLNFFSDGPATQYKQKGNFFLLSTEPLSKGFSVVNWNLFETIHGKGAPDGVGGAIKRAADRLVSPGKDIYPMRSPCTESYSQQKRP